MSISKKYNQLKPPIEISSSIAIIYPPRSYLVSFTNTVFVLTQNQLRLTTQLKTAQGLIWLERVLWNQRFLAYVFHSIYI